MCVFLYIIDSNKLLSYNRKYNVPLYISVQSRLSRLEIFQCISFRTRIDSAQAPTTLATQE